MFHRFDKMNVLCKQKISWCIVFAVCSSFIIHILASYHIYGFLAGSNEDNSIFYANGTLNNRLKKEFLHNRVSIEFSTVHLY